MTENGHFLHTPMEKHARHYCKEVYIKAIYVIYSRVGITELAVIQIQISWLCEVDLPLCDFLGSSTAYKKLLITEHQTIKVSGQPGCWEELHPERW